MSENSKNAIKKVSSRVLICPWAKKQIKNFIKAKFAKNCKLEIEILKTPSRLTKQNFNHKEINSQELS